MLIKLSKSDKDVAKFKADMGSVKFIDAVHLLRAIGKNIGDRETNILKTRSTKCAIIYDKNENILYLYVNGNKKGKIESFQENINDVRVVEYYGKEYEKNNCSGNYANYTPEKVLKEIATNESHYVSADPDSVVNAFNNIGITDKELIESKVLRKVLKNNI